jgi:hypothetical protein
MMYVTRESQSITAHLGEAKLKEPCSVTTVILSKFLLC